MEFLRAVEIDNTERLQELIDANGLPNDPNCPDYALLNYALSRARKESAKMLIERGCQVNPRTGTDRVDTPLHYAIKLDSIEIVELLLRKNADSSAKNRLGETPLHLAAKMRNYLYTDLLLTLLTTDACDLGSTDKSGLTYLHIACMRNNTGVIEHLLTSNSVNINAQIKSSSTNSPGYAPLHYAIDYENASAAQLLLNHNADVNAKAKSGLTPLHMAVKKGYLELVKLLVQQSSVDLDSQVDLDADEWPGYAALHLATEFNSLPILQQLLLHPSVDPNIKTRTGLTALHIAVKRGRSELVDLLLQQPNVDVNCCDLDRMSTPLHMATTQRQDRMIRMLLNRGANVNVQQCDGTTSLHIAVTRSFGRSVSRRCASVFRFPFVFLHRHHCETRCESSFRKKNNEIVDLILSADNITEANPVDYRGLTHFHVACMRKKVDVVQQYLELGVEVDQAVRRDSPVWPGYTALHFAAELDRLEIVQMLLRHGADVKAVNAKGMTPLHLANKSGWLSFCDILYSSLFTRF